MKECRLRGPWCLQQSVRHHILRDLLIGSATGSAFGSVASCGAARTMTRRDNGSTTRSDNLARIGKDHQTD